MEELTGSDILPRLLAVFILIAINAFFVTAEFSIVSVRRSRIHQLSESGDRAAKAVYYLQHHIDRLLSTTQLGITLSSLALGWIGQDAIAQPLALVINRGIAQPLASAWTQWSGFQLNQEQALALSQSVSHGLAIPIAFCLIVYLQLVLGELCPKSVALIYAEDLSRLLAPPSVVIARFFKPIIGLLNLSTRCFLKSMGVKYDSADAYNRLTPEELQLIISTSSESPGLGEEERERLANLFEFGEATATEVMVPRTQIVALSETDTVQTLLQELSLTGHSRYPVMGDSLDEIKGIVYFKDVAEALSTQKLDFNNLVDPWIVPPQFIPETMVLSDVLAAMQQTNQAMLIVVDEFGGTAGLITLQDLINEILGDCHDLEHPSEPEWHRLNDGSVLVQAQMPLDEVNDVLASDFPIMDDYHTLAGFMIHHLQRIPEPGESLEYGPWELLLVEAEDNRLHTIQVRSLIETGPGTGTGTGDVASSWPQMESPAVESLQGSNSSSNSLTSQQKPSTPTSTDGIHIPKQPDPIQSNSVEHTPASPKEADNNNPTHA